MTLDTSVLTPVHGYLEGDAGALDPAWAETVSRYKREVCKNYISLNPEQIESRLAGTVFHVTRKYDGELAVLFWDGENIASVNTGGRARVGLPCLAEAASRLEAANISQAVIAAELYREESGGRSRVYQTREALADEATLGALRLAAFDVLSVEGQPLPVTGYADTYAWLQRVFDGGALCAPVRRQVCDSKAGVRNLFSAWVKEESGEGLVVRSELPIIFKVKPRHSLDMVVVGYSEGMGDMQGQLRSLLVALMPEDGVYQVIGHVGSGFSEEQRRALLQRLAGMVTSSSYTETDANHVAFRMVCPEWVIEAQINDVIFETSAGPQLNPQLVYRDGYARIGSAPGVSIIFPSFTRLREDKTPNAVDTRYSQIDEIAWQPVAVSGGDAALPASTLLRREVYRKDLGGKLMVQKYLAWRTNKTQAGYPAYVFTYTDFSSGRAEPLKVETRISHDEAQITSFFEDALAQNVKKGWLKVD